MGAFGRANMREYGERIAARVARATARPLPYLDGTLKSYDPSTGLVVVTIYTGNQSQDIGPMLYLRPWCGNGYGIEVGLEPGLHVGVLCVDREGNDYVAFDAAFDADHSPLGAQPSELYIQDKRGSFVKWMADSSLRFFAAGIAYLYGATKTYLGAAAGIDDTQDAVVTKRYLDQALSSMTNNFNGALDGTVTNMKTWTEQNYAQGSYTPPTSPQAQHANAPASNGSSKVKAVQ